MNKTIDKIPPDLLSKARNIAKQNVGYIGTAYEYGITPERRIPLDGHFSAKELHAIAILLEHGDYDEQI